MEHRLTHLEKILLNSDAMLLFTIVLAFGVIVSLVAFNLDIARARPGTGRARFKRWKWTAWLHWGG